MPSISIVTICKNAGATIGRTLASIAECPYPRLQYVVVDGGSTDDTCEQIHMYRSRIDKYISEPDQGISDALNKAVEHTNGDYHLIVHADDVLLPDSLGALARAGAQGSAKVICGSVAVVGNGGGVVRTFISEPQKLLSKMSVPHMGSLIRRDAWESVGRYDTRRKIAMDHLLMLRILSRFGLNAFTVVDALVALYSLGGVSDRNVDMGFREVRENLIEEGYGHLRADLAYLQLTAKSRIARILGRR